MLSGGVLHPARRPQDPPTRITTTFSCEKKMEANGFFRNQEHKMQLMKFYKN